MTTAEKIMVATGVINLMAAQVNTVVDRLAHVPITKETPTTLGMVGGMISENNDALEACLAQLNRAAQDLGNFMDAHDIVDDDTALYVNGAFKILNQQPLPDEKG